MLRASWGEFLLGAGAVYLAVNLVFATLYALIPGAISGMKTGGFEECFYFSVQTMATIGYGGMMPASRAAHVLVTGEAFLGILFTALTTGVAFAKFSKPRARVLFARHAVIRKRNGVPHLMFRMANERHNLVVDARLRVVVLRTERTDEGEMLRTPIELQLVRNRNALFPMTWTAMHKIDEASPFFGEGALEKLAEERVEVYLSLIAFDETSGQTIHALHRYDTADIEVGAAFADVLQILPDGTREIDYERFHDTVPAP